MERECGGEKDGLEFGDKELVFGLGVVCLLGEIVESAGGLGV